MNTKIFTFFLFCTFAISTASIADDAMLFGNTPKTISVNNRILANPGGKAISVIDVMKKMDMTFYTRFPEYASMPEARFQFYQANWKAVLQDLIDKELVMTDAKECKFLVSDPDVRQEMEKLFGPNILENLNSINLTFEEAKEMIREDITIRRVLQMRAHAKAMNRVTPQALREAYEKHAKENVRPDNWQYYVISVRHEVPEEGESIAQYVYSLLTEKGITLDHLLDTLEHEKGKAVNISNMYDHDDSELSVQYKEILALLDSNSYSTPSKHTSRSSQSPVFRVFYLKEKTEGGTPSFDEVEINLHNSLANTAVEEETIKYLDYLCEHFDIPKSTELIKSIPEDFAPFILH